MPKLKPYIAGLGMNPAYWSRFTFMAKQTWWDERASWAGSIRRLVWVRKPWVIPGEELADAYRVVREMIDAQPVPIEDREIR